MSIVDILPAGLTVGDAERDAILEIAYLVTAVDGKLADDELAAFGDLAAHFYGRASSSQHDLDALLQKFGGVVDRPEIAARMQVVAKGLPAALHEVAYKTALAMAFVDHDPHPTEDELHKVLGDALGLDAATRERLSHAVTLDGGKSPRSRLP